MEVASFFVVNFFLKVSYAIIGIYFLNICIQFVIKKIRNYFFNSLVKIRIVLIVYISAFFISIFNLFNLLFIPIKVYLLISVITSFHDNNTNTVILYYTTHTDIHTVCTLTHAKRYKQANYAQNMVQDKS